MNGIFSSIVSFTVFQFKSNQTQLFPESDTQVKRKFEFSRISNFCFPFHTFPCMESYGSTQFHVWNHMIPCVDLHERSVGHGSMHGIVWNHTDHKIPCMELHGSLMNLDPGRSIFWDHFSHIITPQTPKTPLILNFFPRIKELYLATNTGLSQQLF